MRGIEYVKIVLHVWAIAAVTGMAALFIAPIVVHYFNLWCAYWAN